MGLPASPAQSPHVALLLVVPLLLAGCTDTTGGARGADGPEPAVSTPPPPSGAPGVRAGELSLETFPEPADLGSEWGFVADPGDREAPAVHGQPALVRDLADLMRGIVPVDCPARHPMPMPQAALEVRYTFESEPVNAVEVDFPSPAHAGTFFAVRLSALQDCKGATSAEGEVLVGQVLRVQQGVVLSDRWPRKADARRTELMVLKDDSVVMMQTGRALGEEPFSSGRIPDLVRQFRAYADR